MRRHRGHGIAIASVVVGALIALVVVRQAACVAEEEADLAEVDQEVGPAGGIAGEVLLGLAVNAASDLINLGIGSFSSGCNYEDEQTAVEQGTIACQAVCANKCNAAPVPPGMELVGPSCTVEATNLHCNIITEHGKFAYQYGDCQCNYKCLDFAAGCYPSCPNPNPKCCAPSEQCWEPTDCSDTEPPLGCERSTRGAPNAAACEDPARFAELCETYDVDCSTGECRRVADKSGQFQTSSECFDQMRQVCSYCQGAPGAANDSCAPGPAPAGATLCDSVEDCRLVACDPQTLTCVEMDGTGADDEACSGRAPGDPCPRHRACTSTTTCDFVPGDGPDECSSGAECEDITRCKQIPTLLQLNAQNQQAYSCGTSDPLDAAYCDQLRSEQEALEEEYRRDCAPDAGETPTPTPTPSPTPTPYESPTPTPYESPTPTPYESPTPTPYESPTPTPYESPTPSHSP